MTAVVQYGTIINSHCQPIPQEVDSSVLDVNAYITGKIKEISSKISQDESTVHFEAHATLERELWTANCFIIPLVVYPVVTLIGHLFLALTSDEWQARYADNTQHVSEAKLKSRVNCEFLLSRIESGKQQLKAYMSVLQFVNDIKLLNINRVYSMTLPSKNKKQLCLDLNQAELLKIRQILGTLQNDTLHDYIKSEEIPGNYKYIC